MSVSALVRSGHLPVIALVGRPNVGKSTLFNRLTRSRDAIVADFPGLTRDRHYGHGRGASRPYLCVDTGGFEPIVKEGILAQMAKQTRQAILECDVVIFMCDARMGCHPRDHEIADLLRKSGRPTVLAVNKAEGMRSTATADFYTLGLGEPLAVSSAHGDAVEDLIEEALAKLPPLPAPIVDEEGKTDVTFEPEDAHDKIPRIAIVGKPNAGKSTLINALLGEERLVAFDQPGTTRDAIEVPLEKNGKPYVLIDTAGLRRKGKVFEAIEKFSVIKTLQAIEQSNVAVLLLDAIEGPTEHDAHIASFIVESGRALVVALNKWDAVDKDDKEKVKEETMRKLKFLSFAKFLTLSALEAKGLNPLMVALNQAHAAAYAKLSTNKLTNTMLEAQQEQAPPRKGFSRPKLRYCHQGGQNPPLIIVHGNSLDSMPATYTRFLEGRFRAVFKLEGTPMRVEYRTSDNPFAPEDKTTPTKAKSTTPTKSKYVKAVKDEIAQTAGAVPRKRVAVVDASQDLAPKDRMKLRAAIAKKTVKQTSSTIAKYKETGRPMVKRGQKSLKK
jgi:GTPase